MAKKIRLEHEGTTYTLEFTRNTIRTMENQGFRIDELSVRPVTLLPQLFSGAFLANHRWVKQQTKDEIFEATTHKDALFEALGQMYGEVLSSMMEGESEAEGTEGNANWTLA